MTEKHVTPEVCSGHLPQCLKIQALETGHETLKEKTMAHESRIRFLEQGIEKLTAKIAVLAAVAAATGGGIVQGILAWFR